MTSNMSNWRSLIWFATSVLELHRTGVFVMLFDVWYFLHWKAIIITVNMALNSIRRLFLLCEGVKRNVWILLWLRTCPSSVHLFKYHTSDFRNRLKHVKKWHIFRWKRCQFFYKICKVLKWVYLWKIRRLIAVVV